MRHLEICVCYSCPCPRAWAVVREHVAGRRVLDLEFRQSKRSSERSLNFEHACWAWQLRLHKSRHLFSTWSGGFISALDRCAIKRPSALVAGWLRI